MFKSWSYDTLLEGECGEAIRKEHLKQTPEGLGTFLSCEDAPGRYHLEGSVYAARGYPVCWYSVLRIPAAKSTSNKFCCLEPTQFMQFCWISLNGLRQHCKPRCDALLSIHDCLSPVLAMRDEVRPRDVVSSLWFDGVTLVIRLNFHEPLADAFTGLSEDSWLLGPFVMRTDGTWGRSGSHSLSRVKKYRPSCFPISVTCCCYYYYVRSQVLPVELGCSDAETAW